jgi:hypothetical protein
MTHYNICRRSQSCNDGDFIKDFIRDQVSKWSQQSALACKSIPHALIKVGSAREQQLWNMNGVLAATYLILIAFHP